MSSTEQARLGGAQQLLQHIVAAAEPQRWLEACARGELAELGLTEADGRALAKVDPRRLLIYRKLIRGTLRDTFSAQLPRTSARLGGEALDRLVAHFCEERLPRSQVLRDVSFEMCAFALPHWRAQLAGAAEAIPPFLPELARFELFEFDVYAAQSMPPEWPAADADELSAERAVAFDGSLRFIELSWRADLLPDDAADRTTPEHAPVSLLAYRDAEGSYRQLELTALAAAILRRLWRGEALGGALTGACAAHERALDQTVIDGISEVLADLGERGAMLGGCAPGARKPPSPWALWLCDEENAP